MVFENMEKEDLEEHKKRIYKLEQQLSEMKSACLEQKNEVR
jgi:hypothetical protein